MRAGQSQPSIASQFRCDRSGQSDVTVPRDNHDGFPNVDDDERDGVGLPGGGHEHSEERPEECVRAKRVQSDDAWPVDGGCVKSHVGKMSVAQLSGCENKVGWAVDSDGSLDSRIKKFTHTTGGTLIAGGGGRKCSQLGAQVLEKGEGVAEDSTLFSIFKKSSSSNETRLQQFQGGKLRRGVHTKSALKKNVPIPSSMTPTKRKLILENNTSNLVDMFSTLAGGRGESESPAKKMKLRRFGDGS